MEHVNILTIGPQGWENLKGSLAPLPPQERVCFICRQLFISRLEMNAEFYMTCDGCRHKMRQQGQKHRDHIKKIRLYNNK